MSDDIADDQHGGILRPLSHQVEVAADLFGGREKRRGKLQAGTLGQLGRGERIPDRAQILQLTLGNLEALTQHGEILVSYRRFSTQARVQRLLAVLSVIHLVDVSPLGGHLGAQPPKLWFVFTGVFARSVRGTFVRSISRASRIVSHLWPDCRSRHRSVRRRAVWTRDHSRAYMLNCLWMRLATKPAAADVLAR